MSKRSRSLSPVSKAIDEKTDAHFTKARNHQAAVKEAHAAIDKMAAFTEAKLAEERAALAHERKIRYMLRKVKQLVATAEAEKKTVFLIDLTELGLYRNGKGFIYSHSPEGSESFKLFTSKFRILSTARVDQSFVAEIDSDDADNWHVRPDGWSVEWPDGKYEDWKHNDSQFSGCCEVPESVESVFSKEDATPDGAATDDRTYASDVITNDNVVFAVPR